MIILTLKERRLIEEAVFRFGNDRERSIWAEWTRDHRAVRYDSAHPDNDGKGRMPGFVADMIVDVLSRHERFLQTRIGSVEVGADEAADLCNDVMEIPSTADAIRAAA